MSAGRFKTMLALAGVLSLGLGAPAFAVAGHGTHHHHRHSVAPLSADDPGLKSAAAYVVDRGDSSVWYSRNASVASPIASITKLMTALVVADAQQPFDEVLQVTPEDRALGKGAARVWPSARSSPAAICCTWP